MKWSSVALGQLCHVASGGTPSRTELGYFDGDIPWVKISDMLQGTVTHTDESITYDGLANSSAKIFPKGTLLLSIFATVGRTALLGLDAATNQAIAGITPDSSKLDVGYLRHYLDASVPELIKRSRGVAQVNINLSILRSHPVPLPPLDEQRRIAAILDNAEELRAKRRDALTLLDNLPRALFLEMFGEPLPMWASSVVSAVADQGKGSIRTGPFGSQLLRGEFVEEGIAVLGIDNAVSNEFRWGESRFITPKKYQTLKRYTVHPGDVLITIMGTCGRCAVVPEDIPCAINTKHLCCITLDRTKCLPEFLHAHFLYSPVARHYLQQTTKGAIMSGLNMEIIKNLPLSLPPLNLQHQFAARIEAIQIARNVHQHALDRLDVLFASLQHQAFAREADS